MIDHIDYNIITELILYQQLVSKLMYLAYRT